jgi:hypothetical protein
MIPIIIMIRIIILFYRYVKVEYEFRKQILGLLIHFTFFLTYETSDSYTCFIPKSIDGSVRQLFNQLLLSTINCNSINY